MLLYNKVNDLERLIATLVQGKKGKRKLKKRASKNDMLSENKYYLENVTFGLHRSIRKAFLHVTWF